MKTSQSHLLQYLLPVILIVIVNVFYFFPQFEGKVIKQGDIIQHVGMSKEAVDYRAKTGEEALWTNSMFGGMPTYQISLRNKNNMLQYAERALTLFFERPAGYFIAGMLGFYVLLLLLGTSPWMSLLGAFLFGFTTNNFTLFEAGHNSKLMAIMTSAPVIAGVLLVFKEKYLIGAAVFGIAFGINVGANHPQMTYYLGICLGLLYVMQFADAIRNQKLPAFAKATGILVLMAILALGASAAKLWTTYEYTKDTMRGGQVLNAPVSDTTGRADAADSGQKSSGGLQWDYAMQWSNGTGDVLATFIPKAVGGGSQEWLGPKDPVVKAIGQNQSIQLPTYFGSLPFTSGPAYFGAVALFLFVFGLFVVRGTLKWWMLASVVLTVLMSMGKHFSVLNSLLFDYFPMMNKFRAPSSILSITAIFIPLLGILALSEVVRSSNRETFLKPLYYTTGILGGLALMAWLTGGMWTDFTGAADAQLEQFAGVMKEQRADMLSSSAFRSLMLVSLSALALYLYLKKSVSSSVLIASVSVLGLFDLVQIGKGYLDKRDFVTKTAYKNEFTPRPVDQQILEDKDPDFRVFDMTINTFNSASTSYYHKTIGGYHPAKLQRYQDIVDRHIANNNMAVFNMLNTKYFILPGQDGTPTVQRNPAALGNAWFVNQIKMVPDANAEIDSLTGLDAAGNVIIHKEFSEYVKGMNPSKNGTISLTSYTPNKLDYQYETQGEQFAIFSEIYYGPGKGWQAYLDGKPVEHIRVNYLLRGMRLPSGKHQVTFEFKPDAYYTGEKVSLICSVSLLGLLLLAGFKTMSVRPNESNA
ncbi:MAG: YfhO family protein [Saprospiraceae bacterium]|jgi:hypothetical protein|nr:YfhO family protein [Saprospiraceae bacterium]